MDDMHVLGSRICFISGSKDESFWKNADRVQITSISENSEVTVYILD